MPSRLSFLAPQASSQRSGSSADVSRDSSSTLSFDFKHDEQRRKEDTKASIEQCMKAARKNALKQWS
ncbi:hypothetical protein PG989_002363 [Apiospora arundinis]|uniref:Uncharacterized protein n=1 Tax=Apiospora arundinis TaxID=335852 RepID=A0ABR2HZ93_9PEZI